MQLLMLAFHNKREAEKMDKKELEKMLKKMFIDSDTNMARVAEKINTSRQNLDAKLQRGTLRVLEFYEILNMLGYEIEIKKKNDQ